MEISIILARFWGLYLLIFAVSLLLNRKLYPQLLDSMSKESIMFVTAFFVLLLGVATISVNNIWTSDYRGLITLLGWVSIFKGVVRFVNPEFAARSIKKIKVGEWFYAYVLIGIIIGAYLSFIGFTA